MKTTEHFKNTLRDYLEKRAENDLGFEWSYGNPKKNLDDCVSYILNTVQESGCNGFTDSEIFGMAVHYYDEADINIGKPTNCKVVVNHTVVLTEEEKEQAKQDAINRATNEEYNRLRKPANNRHTNQAKVVETQLSIF